MRKKSSSADHVTDTQTHTNTKMRTTKVLKLKSYDFKKTYYIYPIENMHILTFFHRVLFFVIRFVWTAIAVVLSKLQT